MMSKNAWTPTPALIAAEAKDLVIVGPNVDVEEMLWGMYQIAKRRLREHDNLNQNPSCLIHCWQVAEARFSAYLAVSDEEIVWH